MRTPGYKSSLFRAVLCMFKPAQLQIRRFIGIKVNVWFTNLVGERKLSRFPAFEYNRRKSTYPYSLLVHGFNTRGRQSNRLLSTIHALSADCGAGFPQENRKGPEAQNPIKNPNTNNRCYCWRSKIMEE